MRRLRPLERRHRRCPRSFARAHDRSRNQFLIGTSANQTAFIGTLVGGGGSAGSTSISIVPWAIGESTTGALTAANMGTRSSPMTATPASARSIWPPSTAPWPPSAATDNVRESLSADLTGLAGTTINALVLNNAATAALNVTGSGAGQTLGVTSGAMLFTLTGATATRPTAPRSAALTAASRWEAPASTSSAWSTPTPPTA